MLLSTAVLVLGVVLVWLLYPRTYNYSQARSSLAAAAPSPTHRHHL